MRLAVPFVAWSLLVVSVSISRLVGAETPSAFGAPAAAASSTSSDTTNCPCSADEQANQAQGAGAEWNTSERNSGQITAKDPLEGARSSAVQRDVVPDARGLTMALRAGWAIPQGRQESGVLLSSAVTGSLPIWLDLGYRVSQHLLVGVYSQYAFAFAEDCSIGGCHRSDVRFGLQAQWHFGARQSVDRWIGLGSGFEIYTDRVASDTRRLTGFEFANLQLGEDLSLGRRFGLGPFLSISLGEFNAVQLESPAGARTDVKIGSKALHSWVTIGFRLSFGA